MLALAVEDRADFDRLDAGIDNPFRILDGHHPVAGHQDFAGLRMKDRIRNVTADQTFLEALDLTPGIDNRDGDDPFVGSAVGFANDDILRDVDQTAGQITRVGGTKSGVGQTLSRSSGGVEVIKDGQALAVVGLDRQLDRASGGVGDQAAHAGELTDLVHRATGAGIGHHKDGVILGETLLECVLNLGGRLVPGLDDPFVTRLI